MSSPKRSRVVDYASLFAIVVAFVLFVVGLRFALDGIGTDGPVATTISELSSGANGPEGPSSEVTSRVAEASAAASRAVAASGTVVTAGPISRGDIVRSFATDELANGLLASTSEVLADLQFEVDTSEGFWLIQMPLTTSATVVDADRVLVDVWSVIVISSVDLGVARERWETTTLEMVLVDGVWLADEWRAWPGPSPAPDPGVFVASPAELGEAMDGNLVVRP